MSRKSSLTSADEKFGLDRRQDCDDGKLIDTTVRHCPPITSDAQELLHDRCWGRMTCALTHPLSRCQRAEIAEKSVSDFFIRRVTRTVPDFYDGSPT
jgi:hypothetical protein